MAPEADSLLGHGCTRVPLLGQHCVTETLGAVGVRPFSDIEHRRRLVVRDVGVKRSAARFPVGFAPRRQRAAKGVDDRFQVRRSGPTAAANDIDAELGHKARVVVGKLLRGEVVMHLALDHRRQAGVRQARQREAGMGAQVAEVLSHLCRAGGAVEPDHVGPEARPGS